MYFKDEIRVGSYDVDLYNNMKISSVLKYMQQLSEQHLKSLGLPYEKLYYENLVFLMSKAYMRINRLPGSQEKIVIGTAPVKRKGAQFAREFIAEDLAGNNLISIITLWTLVNPHSRKILRPSAFPYALPYIESSIEKTIGDPQFPQNKEMLEIYPEKIHVKYSNIDVNNHVNNSVYADFACNCLPIEKLKTGISFAAINFHHEAVYNDILSNYTTSINNDEYYIKSLKSNNTLCFEAIIRTKNS